MNFKFVPMKEDYAKQMIESWKYEGEYTVYDYSNEAQDLTDEENWGYSKFAVLCEDGELVGELTIELFGEDQEDGNEGYIDFGKYQENPRAVYEMWIGFGLRPDLTGKGYGKGFISACVEFAVDRYKYNGKFVRLAVSDFNKRAIKTYQRLGFEVFDTYENTEEKQTILWMKKALV